VLEVQLVGLERVAREGETFSHELIVPAEVRGSRDYGALNHDEAWFGCSF
jgi:hypothetical protein